MKTLTIKDKKQLSKLDAKLESLEHIEVILQLGINTIEKTYQAIETLKKQIEEIKQDIYEEQDHIKELDILFSNINLQTKE